MTPNRAEAERWAGLDAVDSPIAPVSPTTEFARLHRWADALRRRWDASGLCVTLGRDGAIYVEGDGIPLMIPAERLDRLEDPCGAGDRFAGAAAVALGRGASAEDAVIGAVRQATAFVAAGGATAWTFPADSDRRNGQRASSSLTATPPAAPTTPASQAAAPEEAAAVIARVRSGRRRHRRHGRLLRRPPRRTRPPAHRRTTVGGGARRLPQQRRIGAPYQRAATTGQHRSRPRGGPVEPLKGRSTTAILEKVTSPNPGAA